MRSKVETFAMYSALFLSASVPAVMSPPDAVACSPAYTRNPTPSPQPCHLSRVLYVRSEDPTADASLDWLSGPTECEIRKRFFFYPIIISIALHMLCILLAMTFCNAMNETAREADVFRLINLILTLIVATPILTLVPTPMSSGCLREGKVSLRP